MYVCTYIVHVTRRVTVLGKEKSIHLPAIFIEIDAEENKRQ